MVKRGYSCYVLDTNQFYSNAQAAADSVSSKVTPQKIIIISWPYNLNPRHSLGDRHKHIEWQIWSGLSSSRLKEFIIYFNEQNIYEVFNIFLKIIFAMVPCP
jgi:hypothetical protein